MTPNAPVKNFRFPRFGENGYTQWVLQGEKGIYDNEEQIRVEDMALRVYSGDERMAKELTLDSPGATIRLKENRAFSKKAIKIVGANFTITGTGWEWIGATKEIVVEADTVVEFTQAITGGLTEGAPAAEEKRTVIKSDQLVLQTTEEDYHFEFSGSVQAVSGDMNLESHILIALADAPGGDEEAPKLGQGKLDSVREIVAMEEVTILQGGRTVRAGEAKFLTREGRATLIGSPQIEVAGAFISGAVVRSQSGELVIEGSPSEGRAQMILTETGGLGLQGVSALSEETIVLANQITMQEINGGNRFLFEEQVEVMSGAVQLQAAKMTIQADQAKKEKPADAEGVENGELKVGEVRELVAEGGVRIEQAGQVATGEKVVFFPAEERCELTGQPKVTNGEAVITGEKMELKPKLAIVTGSENEKVSVELPEMPDLGYKTFTPTLATAEEDEKTEQVEPEVTIVRSQLLRMIEEPDRTLFRFTEDVEVSGTNLEATCARLDVIAKEKRLVSSDTKGTERLEVERIEAHDSVVIKQAGRTATASRAFIMPKEGKVVLEDNAVVNDERGRVSGFRMTLLQGQRKAIVEGGGGPGQERARITLPALPGSSEE
ncbi:LptA/OstA family protein [Coraliomargarita sinensis]|nr:LptA/OstA family protein [Coraliomargarita sinensis]